ncbi:MAG: DUF2141 domain-containing protein [Flavobacteriales bacterium]|nr:DUF2141 domain-containing protein [Flavobacteriales bacterium]
MKLLLHLLLTISFFTTVAAQDFNSGTIVLSVNGFNSNKGKLWLALYDNAKAFPSSQKEAIRTEQYEIKNNRVSIKLENINYGIYAISVFHDENSNGKMDANWIGIPQEGIGASNNAKGFMGPPKFEDAKFELDSKQLDLKINLLDL